MDRVLVTEPEPSEYFPGLTYAWLEANAKRLLTREFKHELTASKRMVLRKLLDHSVHHINYTVVATRHTFIDWAEKHKLLDVQGNNREFIKLTKAGHALAICIKAHLI